MSISFSQAANDHATILQAFDSGFKKVHINMSYIMNMQEEQFLLQKDLLLRHGIKCVTCSGILPENVLVTEVGFNLYMWMEYLQKAIIRVSQLGCKRLIWNDPYARVFPIEGDTNEIKEQIYQFLYMLCNLCEKYRIELLIEPFSTKKTNFLNSIEEIIKLQTSIGKENIFVSLSLEELKDLDITENNIEEYSFIVKHLFIKNLFSDKKVDFKQYSLHSSFINKLSSLLEITFPINTAREELLSFQKLIKK